MKTKLILKLLLIALLSLPFCLVYVDVENSDYVIRVTLDHAFDLAKHKTDKAEDILFLGDSRLISGIDMKLLQQHHPFTFSNLSLGGASFLESYYLLKYYLENHPAPRAVVLSFVPSLHFFDPAGFGHFKLPTVFRYKFTDLLKTGCASKYPILNLDNNRKTLGRLIAHLAGQDSLQVNRKYPFFGQSFDQIKQYFYDTGGFCVWEKSETQVNLHYEPFEWDIKAKEQEGGVNSVELQYLQKIAKLIRDKNVSSTFLLMPITEVGKDLYLSEIHVKWCQALETAHFDKVYNEPLIYENEYFADNSHLNATGRRIYSQYLIDTGIWDEILRGCD